MNSGPFRSERLNQLAARWSGPQVQPAGSPFPAPPPVQPGPYVLGVTHTGALATLTDDDLAGPVTLIVGPPASGKTILAERVIGIADSLGHAVIGVVTKESAEANAGHALPILSGADAALGLDAPPGIDDDKWLARLLTVVEQSSFVHYGARFIAEIACELREKLRSGERVCLFAILHELERKLSATKGWSKPAQHLDSAYNALRRLCGATDLFSGMRGLDWARRFTHSHVLSLRGEPAEAIRVAVLLYLEAFLVYASSRGWTSRALHALFVLDDARVIAKSAIREHAAVDALLNFADLGHASGGGLVLIIQSLNEVSPALIESANTVLLVGSVSAADVQLLRRRLQLTHEQEAYLLTQPQFHAVVHVRRSVYPFPYPVLLLPPAEIPFAHVALERQRRRQQLLAGVRVQLWSPEMAADPNEATNTVSEEPASASRHGTTAPEALDAKAHKLLVTLLDRPWLLQSELGEACDVEGRELTAIREELVASGHVKTHRLLRYALWEVTAKGSTTIGREHTPLAGRGDLPHRFLQRRWVEAERRRGSRASVEHQHPQIGPLDAFAERTDGTRAALEVVLSDDTMERAIEKLRAFDGERGLVVLDAKREKIAQEQIGDAQLTVLTVQRLLAETKP